MFLYTNSYCSKVKVRWGKVVSIFTLRRKKKTTNLLEKEIKNPKQSKEEPIDVRPGTAAKKTPTTGCVTAKSNKPKVFQGCFSFPPKAISHRLHVQPLPPAFGFFPRKFRQHLHWLVNAGVERAVRAGRIIQIN